jgi:hypothetical protein
MILYSQNFCRSCWAFSAVCALEGQLARKLGKYVSLSEQQLVDCDKVSWGCDGGIPGDAYDYILGTSTKGIASNAAYPVSEPIVVAIDFTRYFLIYFKNKQNSIKDLRAHVSFQALASQGIYLLI